MRQSKRPFEIHTLGEHLRNARLKLRLSQQEAARRAGVGTRLWSEVERGARENVSASTILDMLSQVGLTLAIVETTTSAEGHGQRTLSAKELREMKGDLARAEEYGIDLSLLRASRSMTQLERVRTNDEALALFDAITVIPGWISQRPERADNAAHNAASTARSPTRRMSV